MELSESLGEVVERIIESLFEDQTSDLLSFVAENCPDKTDLTPLKIQKLLFYCCGIAMGSGVGDEISAIRFQAWQHGPVVPEVYHHLKRYGSTVVSAAEVNRKESNGRRYSEGTDARLRDALSIYGIMGPWELREESHLEFPWQNAFACGEGSVIDPLETKAHFRKKYFLSGKVSIPKYLIGAGSLALDGIPIPKLSSFAELVKFARAVKARADLV